MRKLDEEQLRLMSVFEQFTGVSAIDCLIEEDFVLFVVEDAAKAIGKGGGIIKKVEEIVRRRIEIVEYSQDPLSFLKNIFRPLELECELEGRKARVKWMNSPLFPSKLKKAKLLLQRLFDMKVESKKYLASE